MKTSVLLLSHGGHSSLYRGIARFAKEHHWDLVSAPLQHPLGPAGWRGDGILCQSAYQPELARTLCERGIPSVNASPGGGACSLPSITLDHRSIGILAASFFLERGYRHFACAPLVDDTANRAFAEGIDEALAPQGLSAHPLPAFCKTQGAPPRLQWGDNEAELHESLRSLPKPLAICCFDDGVAGRILQVCAANDLQVPEAVAVLGTGNDTTLCEILPVPLSSIAFDGELMGYRAAELLQTLMGDETPEPRSPTLFSASHLVERASTDMRAVDHLDVARALRYIRHHYQDPDLCVGLVVAATSLSRRPLEIAFKRSLGQTILESIIQQRLDHVCAQLCSTNDSVAQIATDAGFRRANHLFRTFKTHFGTSPQQFRTASGGCRTPAGDSC